MKHISILAVLVATVAVASAQDGYTHLLLRGGAVFRNAGIATAGLDFAGQHHSSYELSAVFYRNTRKYGNYLLGFNYKHLVVRQKNTALKFRLGGYAGTDLDGFIAAPNAGIEFLHSVSGKTDFTVSNSNGYFFFADRHTRWRITVEAGLRVSF